MNKNIGMVISFIAGAVVGGFTAYKVAEKKYRDIANEEIESVIERFTNRQPLETTEVAVEEEPEVEVPVEKPKTSSRTKMSEYKSTVERVGYDKISTENIKPTTKGSRARKKQVVEEPVQEDSDIYTITPDEFNTLDDYADTTYYYSSDGFVIDADCRILDEADIRNTIGHNPAGHFGEYDDQTVYIRNDRKRIDYEIILSMKTAQEITEE